MPTLDWLNRDAAFRTAEHVPTRVLRPHTAGHEFGEAGADNLLIQGDNLEALKAYGRFYPDFVCELIDGRLLVAEYKGEHLRAVPREIEKAQVGKLWAQSSGGRCVFAMLFKSERGMNVSQQIDAAVSA
jgi:hypothetical protein